MLTDNRADFRTQDWFLIASDGDLVLKLAQDLMIGENEQGQTVLSPAREDALLRITIEHGSLALQVLAVGWTLSQDGRHSVQHLTFLEDLTLRLSLPGSSLLITPDFDAGPDAKADREIRLTEMQTPTLTLTRVGEPVVLVEPEPRPARAPSAVVEVNDVGEILLEEAAVQQQAAQALNRWAHEIPDEQPEAPDEQEDLDEPAIIILQPIPEPIPDDPVDAMEVPALEDSEPPLPPDESLVEADPPEVSAVRQPERQRHGLLLGTVMILALAVPMFLSVRDMSGLGVEFSLSHYRPSNTSSDTPARPEPPTGVPVRNEQERLLIASLLAEAKAYHHAGIIVTPLQSNAVNNLAQVLSMDPANEEALRLMGQCESALIEEAEAAHAEGDLFLARNLVEDVLEFHPEFNDARALLDSWTREPES